MHPVLFHIGNFAVPTYGLFMILAFLAALFLIRHYAGVEGLDRRRTMDALFYTIVVGFIGARVFEAFINWERFAANPASLLTNTGVFMGGLIAAIVFALFWFRHIRIPFLLGLDIIGLVAALAAAIGRWGCFASGCCWGTRTDLPWAVTFPEAAREIHQGLPADPLHPTQIYLSLNSLAILGILMLAYRRKRFHGQIMMLYLMLYGVTRFLIEYVRGDAVRRFVIEGFLSTSQFLSIVVILAAVTTYVALARRHRLSGTPDWQPARKRAPESARGKAPGRASPRPRKAMKARR
jgi:phosphatidylglycerol:prolipoprotein diacylglycerol transferase